jgi:hypothetical protein
MRHNQGVSRIDRGDYKPPQLGYAVHIGSIGRPQSTKVFRFYPQLYNRLGFSLRERPFGRD